VASWNALAVSGLARAGSLLGDAPMLADAAAGADFVLEAMRDAEGRLLRVWNQGRARIPAFLDDHAALLEALLDLHRAGAGARYLGAALHTAEQIRDRFFDPREGDLFFAPDDGEPLVHRPRSDHDGAMPHSTGLAALCLLRAASLAGRPDLHRVVEALLRSHALGLERAAEAFPTLARAALLFERGPAAAVVVGRADDPATRALAERARRLLAPEDAVVVAAPGETPEGVDPGWLAGRAAPGGRATAYVCRGTTCSLPVSDPDGLAAAAREAAPIC
jgi:uncharacterized protein YyaL (SSP411 family)